MANHSATKKDARQAAKRRDRNRYYGKTTRNAIRDLKDAKGKEKILYYVKANGNCCQLDGKTTLDKNNGNVSPHWAFEVSAEDLDKNIARLRSLGIPVIGPVSHRDIDVTSAYFQSPEGHKLEICTWDPYPVEKTTPGRIDFPSLAHDWPNVKTV